MKKLFLLMFSLLLFIGPFINVKAEESEDEITVDYYNDSNLGIEVNGYNGYVMYGLDVYSIVNFFKPSNATKKEEADYGLRYILDNGYPNKSITDNKANDYFITELAILWYMMDMRYVDVNGEYKDYYNQNSFDALKQLYEQECTNGKWNESCPFEQQFIQYFESDDNILNKAIKLQKNYEKNYTGEIVLSDSSSKLIKSEDGKYYETNWLSVKRSDANKYNVELTNVPEGTTVIDKDGNEKTEFNIDDEFKIKVPVDKVNSNQLNIKINIDDIYNTYYIYKSTEKNLHGWGNMSFKTLSLDDHYDNMIYSKPYQKQIKESKEFYLDIDMDTNGPEIVEVPSTSAYGSIIIATLGIVCVIVSIFVMRRVTSKN